jgi:hypothetical protein
VDRGAAFLIIGASIARQFEFLQGLPRLVTTRAGEDCFIPGIRRCNGSPKAKEGPAQYRTESDPVRPEEDAGFLPRPDAADRARC